MNRVEINEYDLFDGAYKKTLSVYSRMIDSPYLPFNVIRHVHLTFS